MEVMEKNLVIRVGGGSPVKGIAGSLVKLYDETDPKKRKEIELRAIGASSVNQMFKGLACARSLFANRGIDLYVKPGFADVDGTTDSESPKTCMVARLTFN